MVEQNSAAEPAKPVEAEISSDNPRDQYDHPAELRDDPSLTPEQRAEMLVQWKDEVDSELTAEGEGMHFADAELEHDGALAKEAQQVSKALNAVLDTP